MKIPNQPAVVTARGLTKIFAEQAAVDQIDFEVYQSECLGVLGPNGAGKTTTLRMILGHVIPSAGELTVLGYPMPKAAREMRTRTGVVPQQDNLDPEFTVLENLRSYASYFGLRGPALESHIQELLAFTELDSKQQVRVPVLSGGMKRRLSLARALVNKPELLILDEPTTGLDPQARQMIWQRLRQLKAQGNTLILTTHYLEEAERLCDRILIIDHGKILAEGTPRGLIQDHIEAHVIELHGNGVNEWYQHKDRLPAQRLELIGETLFCYADEEQPILRELERWPELEFLHRRANLEDVFLKLTGRELRDG